MALHHHPGPILYIFVTFIVCLCFAVRYDLREFHFVADNCNNTGRFSPTHEVCAEYYRQVNPYLHKFLRTSNSPWSFTVPFTGNYTVRVAGAGGGSGACSRKPGRGAVLEARLFLEVGYGIIIRSLGQKGTSACDTNPTHPVCQLDHTVEDFEHHCIQLLLNSTNPDELMFDGGGGGGGSTYLTITDSGQLTFALFLSGGGGGSSAFPSFANFSSSDSFLSNDRICHSGMGSTNISAGVGGTTCLFGSPSYPSDGGGFDPVTELFLAGGQDCLLSTQSTFPSTVGGFGGGGGGGCGNGGGGGGGIGGDVKAEGNVYPGGGGSSVYLPLEELQELSFAFAGYNEGHGFIEIFLEGCGCVHDCTPDFEQELFECTCPNGTTSFLHDCMEAADLELFPTPSPNSVDVGSSVAFNNFVDLNNTIYVYSMSVEFAALEGSSILKTDPGDLSSSCVLILTHGATIVGSSEIVRVDESSGERGSRLITDITGHNFTDFLSNPLKVSGMDLIGIDVRCRAAVRWNISIRRDEDVATVTALLSIKETLPLIFNTCTAVEACDTLSRFYPAKMKEPLLSIVLGILIPSGFISVVLIVLLAVVYHRHRRRKVHLQLGQYSQKVNISRSHYQMLSATNTVPLLQNPEYHQYRFKYIDEKDNQYVKLRERKPAEGIDSIVVSFQDFEILRKKQSGENLDSLCSRDELVFIRKLGEGQFGEVMLMVIKELHGFSQLPVAVKLLQCDRPQEHHAFFEEIELMKTLHHPNIVSFLGHCSCGCNDLEAPPLMILEYMALGDLLNLLIANRPKPDDPSSLTETNLCSFAVDIARALQYLSEQNYVHRDVAARNVLVSAKLVAKLADFGLTQSLADADCGKINERLPVYWLSPESLNYKRFTTKSDVWSYGVLLWEMVTYGEFPYGNCDLKRMLYLAKKELLGLKPPPDCCKALKLAISRCQANDPRKRPTFTEIENLISAHYQLLATGTICATSQM